MSGALAIARQELREKKMVFAMAVLLAVLVPTVALLPGVRHDRATVVSLNALVVSLAAAFGTALASGISVIGRDLVERRLSFYFARPVSAAAIWSGKALAALVASISVGIIAAIPGIVAGWKVGSNGELLTLIVVGCPLLFLIGHALSTVVRSRSGWIALDAVAAMVAGAALLLIFRPLIAGSAFALFRAVAIFVAVAVVAALAAAPVWQLERGRVDAKQNHRAFSLALWSAVAVVLLLAGGFVLWVVSLTPASLDSVFYVRTAANGGRVFVTGKGAHRADYTASFVVAPEAGKARRLPIPGWTDVTLSRDGQRMAWLEPDLLSLPEGAAEIHLDPPSQGKRTVSTSAGARIILSDDGSRAAVDADGLVSIYDTAQWQLLATAAIRPRGDRAMFFVSPQLLRIVSGELREIARTTIAIDELDAAKKRLTRTAELELDGDWRGIAASADGSRILIRERQLLIDGHSGRLLGRLPAGLRFGSTLLSDGTAVVATAANGGVVLRMFDPAGAPAGEVLLPGVARAYVVGELPGRRIVVAGARAGRGAPAGSYDMVVTDLAAQAVVTRLASIKGPMPQWAIDPRLPFYTTRELAAVDGSGRLVLWNVETGAKRAMPGA